MRVALALWAALTLAAAAAPGDEGDRLPEVAAPSPCIACEVPVQELRDLVPALELERLRDGEILIVEQSRQRDADSARGSTRATALVPRPPRDVWRTLVDFESWPGFMPLLDDSEVARRQGDQVWVRQRFSVMFVGMRHTTVYDLAPRAGELRWALDEQEPADIEASRGSWKLVPIDGGRATLLRYEATMSSGRAVPGFVQDMLLRRSLRKLLASLRTETERRNVQIVERE